MVRVTRTPPTFTVSDDAWGYTVSPAQEDYDEIFIVKNALPTGGATITIDMPGYIATTAPNEGTQVSPKLTELGPGAKQGFIDTRPKENDREHFYFKCWTGAPNQSYRARAKSDPRANPKG